MVTRKFAYSKVVSFIICMGFGLGAWGGPWSQWDLNMRSLGA